MHNQKPDVHLTVEILHGPMLSVPLMHHVLYRCDPDWPYCGPFGEQWRFRVCAKCGGRIYRNPRLVPEDIKAAARQCGVKLKVRRYAPKGKCFGESEPERYTYL